jgi:hypothetical protein
VKSINHICRADFYCFDGLHGCVRALLLVEWPGFLSLVEVVFCTGVLGYVHSLGCGGGGGGYGWGVIKRVSKIALGNMVCSSFR